MSLALAITARRLCLYFLSHPIGVKMNMSLKQTLGKPDTFGRLVKWAVELIENGGSTYGGHLQSGKMATICGWSSTTQGSSAGIVITSPYGEDLEFVVKFGFKASNNEVEYEALVIGMRMTHEVRARHLVAYSDS
ncbi:UNVERIFIED_CONTAM: hypothetical protein Scaly_2529200 [Sesamum calycinum]|uniref:RNase H type-1 domain-containing protein n=1 Tax=Sesamum calycinum TaxID=2727403 RepID=A0AAW2LVR0_9LAMI